MDTRKEGRKEGRKEERKKGRKAAFRTKIQRPFLFVVGYRRVGLGVRKHNSLTLRRRKATTSRRSAQMSDSTHGEPFPFLRRPSNCLLFEGNDLKNTRGAQQGFKFTLHWFSHARLCGCGNMRVTLLFARHEGTSKRFSRSWNLWQARIHSPPRLSSSIYTLGQCCSEAKNRCLKNETHDAWIVECVLSVHHWNHARADRIYLHHVTSMQRSIKKNGMSQYLHYTSLEHIPTCISIYHAASLRSMYRYPSASHIISATNVDWSDKSINKKEACSHKLCQKRWVGPGQRRSRRQRGIERKKKEMDNTGQDKVWGQRIVRLEGGLIRVKGSSGFKGV